MNHRTFGHVSTKAARILAAVLMIATLFSLCTVSASAYEVKGNTIADVLDMDGAIYYKWLKAHESDRYYLTTPYAHADHRNPNGDCDGANGSLDTPGVPAMNCMGLIWHELYMPTRMSGGDTGSIPAYGKGGWYGLYVNNNISRRYFYSKRDLLASGYAEYGDIIWMFKVNEHVADDSNHICIYMGNGHSDRIIHAVPDGCEIGYISPNYEEYVVLKAGTIPKLDTPVLKSTANTAKGAKITWKKVNGATWYRVFVKVGNKWKVLGNTKNNYFIDKTAKSNQKTTYTVRCVDREGRPQSGYSERGISNIYYAAPAGFRAEGTENGINFSWNAVDGAAKYRVYRRRAGEDWTVIARTTETSFLDKTAQKGIPYLYTVRVLDKNGATVSDFNTPIKAYIISDIPQITECSVSNSGLTLGWKSIRGAEQYVVSKKSGTSWKTVGYTTTNSFTYKTPDRNVESVYTVRCINSTHNAMTSGFDRTGFAAMYQMAPKMARIDADATGLKLSWNAQQNAKLYRVYKKNDSNKWVKLADTAETTLTDTAVEPGKTYTYTLRCLTEDGTKLVSGFVTSGWSSNYAAAPQITATANALGIQLNWNKENNAAQYRVFVKKDGKWTGVANTKNTSYLYTDVNDGEAYTFTVRCVDTTKWFNSFYDVVGATATYVDPNPPTEAPTNEEEEAPAETGIAPSSEPATETETIG